MSETFSQAEYARRRGVSRFCATDWKKKGLLIFVPDGRVDVAASDAKLDSRPAVYRGGVTNRAPGTSVPLSGTSVPAKLRKSRPADPARFYGGMNYELKSGSTVSVKEIELFLSQRVTAPIRDHILGWPGKLAEMCAERSRAEIEELLLREAYEVLEELAEGLPT